MRLSLRSAINRTGSYFSCPRLEVDSIPELSSQSVEESLKKLLAHPTIASKRWVWQQYDHQVMSGCTVEPGSDAGVVHLSIAGIDKRLAISNDCNNRFCYLDPYKGAQIAFAECMRNLACSGAQAPQLQITLILPTQINLKHIICLRVC